MTLEGMASDAPDRDWEALLSALHEVAADDPRERAALTRRLAEALPDRELGTIIEGLSAEQARLRGDRYEQALARARASMERGDLDAARVEAEAACRIDFVRWEAHRLLGEILERAGDARAALYQVVTAIHLGWDSEEASRAVRRLK